MSELDIDANGCMVMREEAPFPCFEDGEPVFSTWISNACADENADKIVDNWYERPEVGFLSEFTPSQLLDRVEDWYMATDGIDIAAKPSLEKMRAELVSMIERIDQMKFVEEA